MKKYLSILILLLLAPHSWAAYIETFDTGSADWIYGYGPNYTEGTTEWSPTNGNPDGYISGVASNLYAVWTYETASYGDMRGLFLTIDTKINNTVTGDAQLYVGRAGTYYISDAWNISSNTNWTTHTEALTTNNFSHWSSGNKNPLSYVLEAPDDIGIFFGAKLADGDGTLSIDNFGTSTVPEPVVASFIGGLALFLIIIHRTFLKIKT